VNDHRLPVSVIVPTRDRPDALAACLAALEAQEIEVDVELEVVVVDDASTDGRRVAEVVARSPRARLVRGQGAGPAAARNRGAGDARGQLLCFTDDDCRPGPRWVASLARRTAESTPVVAGPTRNGRPADPVTAASQAITNHLVAWSFDPARGTVAFAPTSNLAVSVEVWRLVPFDERFPLAAGEDREWCARLAAHGAEIVFEPEAWVDHHPDLDLRGFWRQQVRYGRGARRLDLAQTEARRLQSARFYLDLLRAGAAEGPVAGGLVALAQAATAVGLAQELVATRRRPT